MEYAVAVLIIALAIIIAIRPPHSRPGRLPLRVSMKRDDTPQPSAAIKDWRRDAGHSRLLSPKLPSEARVMYNHLSDPQDEALLVADIMLVNLPNGNSIDVGWYPEDDPDGTFQICLFRNEWDQQLIDPIEAASPREVVRIVEGLATRFAHDGCPACGNPRCRAPRVKFRG